MAVQKLGVWVPCDSRADLKSRLPDLEGRKIDCVVTDGASAWGYMILWDLVVPIGFVKVGIEPYAVSTEDVIAIGMGDHVIGIDRPGGKVSFRYRMPTIFHDFIRADERGFLIKDEIGFVWLSKMGEELWNFSVDDLIDEFMLENGKISGRTFEGRTFVVDVPR